MSKIAVLTQAGLCKSIGRAISTFAEARGFKCSLIVVSDEDSDTIAETVEAMTGASVAVVLLQGDEFAERATATLKLADASPLLIAVWADGAKEIEWPANTHHVMPINTKPLSSDVFETWVKTFWGALEISGLPSRFPLRYEATEIQSTSVSGRPVVSPYRKVKVVKNTLLTAEGYERPSYCLTLDLSGSGLTYNLGDHLVIYPENSDKRVEEALSALGVSGDQIFEIRPLDETGAVEPAAFALQPLKVRDLMKYFMDIQGKASRKFVAAVAAKAADPLEAAQLRTLAFDMKPKSPYFKTVSGVFSYISLLTTFKSIKLTLADFISVVPVMRPRYYSASSSPLKDPNQVECTFVVLQYPTANGIFEGLSTTYLSSRKPGDELLISIRPLAKPLRLDDKVRYIGVALGSGVALLRGISQHLNCMKEAGTPPTPMLLYYGVRHEKKDFIFAKELADYASAGVLHLHSAFSHDTAEFITPAHRIREHPDRLVEYIVDHNKDCYFVYCGPAGPAYTSMETAICEAIAKMRPEIDPKHLIDEMKSQGRWNAQAFTPNPDPENPFSF